MILPGIGALVSPGAAGITPALVVIRASSQTGGTTFTPAVAGVCEKLLAVVGYKGGSAISANAGWTEVTQVQNGVQGGVALFTRTYTGTDTLTITNSNNDRIAAHVYLMTNVGASVAANSAATADPPSVTTTWGADNTFWIIACANGTSTSPTPPAGWGDSVTTSPDANLALGTADKVAVVATLDPATFTTATSGPTSLTVAVQPK